jgi:hypothetical protein
MTETSARQKLRVSFSARCSFCSRATAVVAFLCSLALMLLGGCNGSGSSTPAPPASILGVAVATNPPGMSSGARLLAVRRRAHSPDISSLASTAENNWYARRRVRYFHKATIHTTIFGLEENELPAENGSIREGRMLFSGLRHDPAETGGEVWH